MSEHFDTDETRSADERAAAIAQALPTQVAHAMTATAHYAALGPDGAVLAVGSVMPEGHPHEPREGDWRVRGMASEPELRGRGLGKLVLAALEAHARTRGGRRLWCNARTGARAFYEREGWSAEGEQYEIEGIGPHFLMAKALR